MGRHYDYRKLQGRHYRNGRTRRLTVMEQVRGLLRGYMRLLGRWLGS